MTDEITLHGFPVSPHVRAVRLAFIEAGIDVVLNEIGPDHLATDEYARINPFRKMPALTQGRLTLYETPALMSYAAALGRTTLEPIEPLARAKMWQFVGIAQHYLFPIGVMQLYFHNVLAALFGMEPNRALAESAVQPTNAHLDVLEGALEGAFLAGDQLTLADLYCGAMVDYVARTRDGVAAMKTRPKAATWLAALRARPSFEQTFPPMLVGTDQG